MKLFCFGLGYTARTLVAQLPTNKWQFSGTRRTNSEILFDAEKPLRDAQKHFKGVTHLLVSIPPDADIIDPVLFHHQNDLNSLAELKWVGYLSATSVYGDKQGGWVDENSPCAPTERRGKLRLAAENMWLDSGLPIHIFRLGGIYGPDRNQLSAVQNRTAKKILKENHYFSRIHVSDLARALFASMQSPSPGAIYNIVDDQPASSAEVLDHICATLDLPFIEGASIEDADISDSMRSFYRDNKRVRNDYAKSALGWSPEFLTYREGYRDILAKLNNSEP